VQAKRLSNAGVATVNVGLIKPWDGIAGCASAWDDIAANWQKYGDVPMAFIEMDNNITEQMLNQANIDVMMLSDCSGGNYIFSPDEINAIFSYARAGHGVVGTYAVFQNGTFCENRALCPLFGFVKDTQYTFATTNGVFSKIDDSRLSSKLTMPLISSLYNQSQVPAVLTWKNEMTKDVFQAIWSDDSQCVLTCAAVGPYLALYISTMPEYSSNYPEWQLVYNMIVYSLCNFPTQYAYKDSLLRFSIAKGPDSLNYGYVPLKSPAGMTVSLGGTVSWRPATDSSYTEFVTFKIIDDLGNHTIVQLRIVVNSKPPLRACGPLSGFKSGASVTAQREGDGFRITLPSSLTSAVEILDCSGRIMAKIPCLGRRSVVWSCRSATGERVAKGRYYISTKGDRFSTVTSIMVP
jgi:hypothetical protein